MMARRLFHFFLFQLLPVLVLGSAGAAAVAQVDPPGRVGRLNHVQGPVVFSPAGDNEWTEAELNRPLTRGDRLWTDRGSRAEIQLGSSAVRMDGRTHLEILALDDQSVQLSVTQGAVYLRVRSLPDGESFEIDTPNVAYRAVYPGDYRIDVDAATGTTRVTIHSGTGAVYGESGQALPLGGGQQITFRDRSLVQVNAQESPPQDTFDRWAAERNRQEDQSISARYVPREVVGYQQLDAHGLWTRDATHGMVWYPHGMAAGWAPYRQGHWEWISPWGWTWMDDAPWGFAPFHYGRWAMIDSRWAWVPGRLGLHPVYAPALVAFIGERSGAGWNLSGPGRAGVAWFPLAPGEAWQPPYRASPVYISNVNRNIAVQPNAGYAYQRTGEALTVISADDFHRGRPATGGWLRVAANTLTNAQIVPPPAMPQPGAAVAHQRALPSQIAPPPGAEVRQVIARTVAPEPAADRSQRAQAAAPAKPAPAKPDAQSGAVQQARISPPAAARQAARSAQPMPGSARSGATSSSSGKVVVTQQTQAREQARRERRSKREQTALRTEQVKREPRAIDARQATTDKTALRAGQARGDQQARAAQKAKREQIARRTEPARRGQLARRGEQAAREQQARKAAQARHDAQAQRDERLRRETHAQRVEQARRAAEHDVQVLQEQRAAREEHARRAAEREAQLLREQRAQREAQEREQREASQRQQQALSERALRDRQQWEQQQRERVRRPALRDDRRAPAPEIWQRSIPIMAPGRTS